MEISEKKSDRRSFGSNIYPSSQSRKISIGVMSESVANTRYGAMKRDMVSMPNTERVISNGENFNGEKSKVEGVTPFFNTNQIGVAEEVKRRSTKSVHERKPTSSTILLENQAPNLPVSTGRLDKPDGIERTPQLFSNQTSNFHVSNYNQTKFGVVTSNEKGKKDGIPEREEDVTFTTAQELESKRKLEDKRNKTENITENLKMKLCQILGNTSSPKTHHSGSQTCNRDEERLPFEQRFDQKNDKFDRIKQNSNAKETVKNPDHTNRRNKKSSSAKMQSSKSKTPRDKEKNIEKGIFSSEKRWTGGRGAYLDNKSPMSLRHKGQRKNSKMGPRKICFLENDMADKLCKNALETDVMPQDEEMFSLGNRMGGSHCCLSDHQKECLQSEKIIHEKKFYQSPTVKKADQHRQVEDSANGNQQEDRSNPIVENDAGSQNNFHSPTLRLKTPSSSCSPSSTPRKDQKVSDLGSPASTETQRRFSRGTFHSPIVDNVAGLQNNFHRPKVQLKTPSSSSSPSSTPRKDQKVSDLGSPASTETERRFSWGTSRNLRTAKTLEPGCNKRRGQRLQDVQELKDSLPRIDESFVEEKAHDCRSDSSFEKGSRERHTAEKQTFMPTPIKQLCRNESIKFNDDGPASPSSKGTGETDCAHEASEQNEKDEFVRAVELLTLELEKVNSKLKSVTSQKSSEIMMSVAEDIHLQLQNVHSKIQTDIGKLINLSKSKRKRLETSFEGHKKHLRLVHEKFKEEVNLQLRDCRSTIEGLEADQMEIKGVLEKQRASHRKLLSQVEEAVEIQLNDAQRKITAIQELGKRKLLELKHVIAVCLKEVC